MKEMRAKVEKEIFTWKDVSTKKMFGCPCYSHKDKLFAFIVTGGVVITQLNKDDRVEGQKKFKASPFTAGKKTVKKWLKIPVKSKLDLRRLFPYLKVSYKRAS